MSWIGRAISSVGQYYKEINPATLSGAIDVIVVSNKPRVGQDSSEELVEELACSPWHVRFGKLSVLRPVERKVWIVINGEPAPFSMKIGETGEAFFVFETDVEDLPDDLQTSPLVSPMLKSANPRTTDPQASTSQHLDIVPDFDDLGESQLQSNEKDWRDSQTDHASPSGATDDDTKPSSKVEEKAWLETGEIDTRIKAELEGRPRQTSQTEKQEEGEEVRQAARAQQVDSTSTLEPNSSNSAHPHLDLSMSQHSLSNTGDLMLDMEGYKMTASTEEDPRRLSHSPNGISSDRCGLKQIPLLDGQEEQEDPKELPEDELMNFTTALLRCSEEVNNYLIKLSSNTPEIEHNANVVISASKHDDALAKPNEPGLDEVHDQGHPCKGLVIVEPIRDQDALGRYDRFKLKSNGRSHKFEISLFNGYVGKEDPNSNLSDSRQLLNSRHIPRRFSRKKFCENRLTCDFFFTPKSERSTRADFHSDLLDDEANYIVKYNDKFILTWDNASTALTALGIYRKSLLGLGSAPSVRLLNDVSNTTSIECKASESGHDSRDELLNNMSLQSSNDKLRPNDSATDSQSVNTLQPPPSYSRPWRWWYKNERLQTQDPHHHRSPSEDTASQDKASFSHPGGETTSANTSPPASPPASPKSLSHQSSHGVKPGTSSTNPPRQSPTTVGSSTGQNTRDAQPEDSTEAPHKLYAKTLRLTSDQLKQLKLKKGINHVSFSVRSSYSGFAVCTSRIFLWESDYQICISDIDGTITKSDALGHVFTMIGRDWTHAGVAKLYTDIARNGYKIMYLTSRAIGQADTTREYLKNINQMGYTLPEGPVIMSPDRLMTSLHREVIMRKPELFKMACLRDIQRLFGRQDRTPFYAGFGNRITDALSYRSVGVPSSKIFTIDSNGEVKMELLELTGYKSSYIHMTDLVDQMFPPINRNLSTPEYTDFNYWRSSSMDYGTSLLEEFNFDEILDPNYNPNQVMPASPALSARSGTSSVPTSRLTFRLSSLSLVRKTSKVELNRKPSFSNLKNNGTLFKSSVRASSPASRTLSTLPPVLQEENDANRSEQAVDSGSEEDEGAEGRIPSRLRSDSMPGSLPGSVEEASLLESLTRESFEINPRRSQSHNPDAVVSKTNGNNRDTQGEQKRENSGQLGVDEEGVGEEDDDFPQMDFSSVPYL